MRATISAWILVSVVFLAALLPLAGCSPVDQTPAAAQISTSTDQPGPTIRETSTPEQVRAAVTPLAPTQEKTPTIPAPSQTPAPTVTDANASSSLRLSIIVPEPYCGMAPKDRLVREAAWLDNSRISYGYYPFQPDTSNEEPLAKLQWNAVDLASGMEKPTDALIQYNHLFWGANSIPKYTTTPELYGLFSPSGRYVLYPNWHGSVFDAHSKTEIWVADLQTQERFLVGTFGYSNVYITRAAWFAYERQVIFSTTYEGPASFTIADVKTRSMYSLDALTGNSVLTETTWRLSPDGTLLAVSYGPQLELVSLQNGQISVIDAEGGYDPRWSADGRTVYYWKASGFETTEDLQALVAYNRASGQKRILLRYEDIARAIQSVDVEGRCRSYLETALWNYQVAPDESAVLFFDGGLYLVENTASQPTRFAGLAAYRESFTRYPTAFLIGAKLSIAQAGSDLRVHAMASVNGEVLARLKPGDRLTLIDGPVQAEGYRWWKARVSGTGSEGWVVENRLWFENLPDS